MYHKLVAVITIAAVMTTMSQASARELNSAELKSLFSNTTVNWTNQKGNKTTLSLNSDGSAKFLVVTPRRKVRREGKWWIKEPNIHCVKWVKRKKNTCRRIGNVEESGEGWTTNRKGITWTITKMKEKVVVSGKNLNPDEIKEIFNNSIVQFTNGNAKVTFWLEASGKAKVLAILPQREVQNYGTWWIKEPNIHCVKWVAPKRKACRAVNNIETRGSGYVASAKGVMWSITKRQAKDENNLGSDDSKKLQEQIAKGLKSMVAEIMKVVPKQVDPLTVLSSASSNQDTFTYNYILDFEKDDINASMVSNYRNTVKKGLCGLKHMKLLMKVGAKFKYSYVSKSGGKLLFEYTFGRGECV